MPLRKLFTQLNPQHRLLLALDIINLLFFQDALQNAITRLFIHGEDFVGYDFLHTLGRQVIQRPPILMPVHKVIFHALNRVFVHIRPLFAHR